MIWSIPKDPITEIRTDTRTQIKYKIGSKDLCINADTIFTIEKSKRKIKTILINTALRL